MMEEWGGEDKEQNGGGGTKLDGLTWEWGCGGL